MKAKAAPFPTAPETALRLTVPWQISVPSGQAALVDDVAGWDYQAVLHLSALVDVDVARVYDACHLGPRTKLTLLVTATSSNTKMRGPVFVRDIVGEGSVSMPLDFKLHGHELGGRLFLDTSVVATRIERLDALSPAVDGSTLWRHRKSTWLEGEGARFPTEVADLSSAPYLAPGALWFLDLRSDDLDSAALGSVRLVLNEKHPFVSRLLTGEDSPEVATLMSTLRWDVARRLINSALDNDEFLERDNGFEEDTLGALLAGVVRLHWPGESARILRQVRAVEPARFEWELQDRAGLFSV